MSCGYVGVSDGWQDLNARKRLAWCYAHAPDGNITLTGAGPACTPPTCFLFDRACLVSVILLMIPWARTQPDRHYGYQRPNDNIIPHGYGRTAKMQRKRGAHSPQP